MLHIRISTWDRDVTITLTCGTKDQYKDEGKNVEGSVVGSSSARPAVGLLESIVPSGKLGLEEDNWDVSPRCVVLWY